MALLADDKTMTKPRVVDPAPGGHGHSGWAMLITRHRRMVLIAFAAVLPLAVVATASLVLGIKIPIMTRDVTATAGVHPLTGVLSNLGILLWWTSASLWAFSASVQRALRQNEAWRFARASSLLSAFLATDDLFQIHEFLAPTHLGITEEAVYGGLGIAVLVYLVRFRLSIVRADGLLLLAAFALLAGSVVVDAAIEPWLWRLGHWSFLVEDGLKWLGIAAWCAYCVVRCRSDVMAATGGATQPG